jgi:hypothetical protein
LLADASTPAVTWYYKLRLPMVFCHVLSRPERRKNESGAEWFDSPSTEK